MRKFWKLFKYQRQSVQQTYQLPLFPGDFSNSHNNKSAKSAVTGG
jgi:hypothetical protein